MDQKQLQSINKKKDLISVGCIAMAVIGLILGILFPRPNSLSVGTILAFVAFLLSMSAVKDKGSNLPAMLAFFLSFLAMTVSIAFSGLSM